MELLLTGASGFLGSNIYPLLKANYAISTIGLAPDDDYHLNIAKEIPALHEYYEIVLHAAGKAHSVPKTEYEKQLFFDVNLQGTKNLCSAFAPEAAVNRRCFSVPHRLSTSSPHRKLGPWRQQRWTRTRRW